MRPARLTTATLVGITLTLSLSACSSTQQTTESNEQYCSSSAGVQAEVADLRTLLTSGTATRDDVQLQVESIGNSAKQSALDAADLAESVRADLQAADEAFDAAIDAIPDDASITEAAAAYRAAIDAWDSAVASIRAEVGCS